MRKFIRDIGKGFYGLFIGTLIVALIGGAVAFATNYTVTQGSGTTFGSIVVSAVNYAQQLLCDPATPSQCAAVDASGILTVKGTVTANAGTNLNTSALATSALQTTGNSSLATIASNTAAAIPDCGATPCTNKIGSLAGQPDPCFATAKTNIAISASGGTVQLVAPSGSTQVYMCSLSLLVGTATSVNFVGGTGSVCTTGSPVAVIGSTTAAGGLALAANGGLTLGNGMGTVGRTATGGHGLCLIQSGTAQESGNLTYVQQ